jgi:nucleotide-binding universal stress UspA family protein
MERTVIEFKHILSPVDFSDSSSRSLDHAVALARWYGSRLTVLHVAPTFEPVPVRSGSALLWLQSLARGVRLRTSSHLDVGIGRFSKRPKRRRQT